MNTIPLRCDGNILCFQHPWKGPPHGAFSRKGMSSYLAAIKAMHLPFMFALYHRRTVAQYQRLLTSMGDDGRLSSS